MVRCYHRGVDLRAEILKNAATLREMHDAIERSYAKQPHGPDHATACSTFHANYDRLAFPGGLNDGLERLKQLRPDAVETAIQFLEADPWFHRSGYIKEEILRRLKHPEFSESQRKRLTSLVVQSLRSGTDRVFHYFKNLAPFLDRGVIRSTAEEAMKESQPRICRRARALHDRLWTPESATARQRAASEAFRRQYEKHLETLRIPPPSLPIGEIVSVVLNARNRTPRTGTVFALEWHIKRECWCYYIKERGRRIKKRYFDADLMRPDG